jgi:hypothetical protein
VQREAKVLRSPADALIPDAGLRARGYEREMGRKQKMGKGPMVKVKGRMLDESAVVKAQSAIRKFQCRMKLFHSITKTNVPEPKKKVMVLGGKKDETSTKKKLETENDKREARRQIAKKRERQQNKGRDRIEALQQDIIRTEDGEGKRGAFIGPGLMDLLMRRFQPQGITPQDIDKLANINNQTSPFDLS